MRSEVKWHHGVGVKGRGECVEENGCARPLPCVRQLFVWRSRSLVQALDHAPLHPNSSI